MLLCVALNIQVQLDGITNCRVYAEQDANIKTTDITNRLIQGVVSLCTCDFNSSLLVNPFIVCFDGSQQYVTYRATLTGTNALSARELVMLVKQWIESDPFVVVQSAGLGVTNTCPVVITSVNSPECPQDITNRSLTTSPSTTDSTTTSPTPPPSTVVNIGAVVGGVVAGVLTIAVIVLVILLLLSLLRARRSGSKDISDGKTNNQQTRYDHNYNYLLQC